jgi:hypothetical protein
MTRGQAIASKCRECIHDAGASGTWREQVATCHCSDCPLWRFRPLPRNAPAWIAARDPGNLPADFAKLDHDAAIRRLRENIAAKAADDSYTAHPLTYRDAGATGVAGMGAQHG